MAKFLGGSLQGGVVKQLTARSQYLKAGKFQDGLSALHGNSPFINLYSSVGPSLKSTTICTYFRAGVIGLIFILSKSNIISESSIFIVNYYMHYSAFYT
jgi:hypothetical protein